jgi:hypothetical protein
MPSGPPICVAILGVLAAGAACLPVDADAPAERADLVLAAVGVAAVLGEDKQRDLAIMCQSPFVRFRRRKRRGGEPFTFGVAGDVDLAAGGDGHGGHCLGRHGLAFPDDPGSEAVGVGDPPVATGLSRSCVPTVMHWPWHCRSLWMTSRSLSTRCVTSPSACAQRAIRGQTTFTLPPRQNLARICWQGGAAAWTGPAGSAGQIGAHAWPRPRN